MDQPYTPPPGYSNQPGYPPPRRQGMGCFAKGCITLIVVIMLVGVLIGVTGMYVFRNFTAFVSPTPVSIRTLPATQGQYQAVMGRYTDFIRAINAGHAATFSLSSDDLNTLIARDPECKDVRGKLYMEIKDSEIVAESSFPIPRDGSRASSGTAGYFNGRVYFAASFSSGELTMRVRKVESMDGKPMSDAMLWMFNKIDIGKIFNEAMRDEQRKGTAWAEATAKVQKIVIEKDHVVATAVEGAASTNPIPLPGEKDAAVASPSPSE